MKCTLKCILNTYFMSETTPTRVRPHPLISYHGEEEVDMRSLVHKEPDRMILYLHPHYEIRWSGGGQGARGTAGGGQMMTSL